MPAHPESETKGRDYLWALAVPLIMVLAAGLLGLLLFDVLGAGYLGSIFRRLF